MTVSRCSVELTHEVTDTFAGSQGSLTLRENQPVLTYSGVGRSKSVSRIQEFLEKMTAAVGGDFIANPAWTLLGSQEITVHPMFVQSP